MSISILTVSMLTEQTKSFLKSWFSSMSLISTRNSKMRFIPAKVSHATHTLPWENCWNSSGILILPVLIYSLLWHFSAVPDMGLILKIMFTTDISSLCLQLQMRIFLRHSTRKSTRVLMKHWAARALYLNMHLTAASSTVCLPSAISLHLFLLHALRMQGLLMLCP